MNPNIWPNEGSTGRCFGGEPAEGGFTGLLQPFDVARHGARAVGRFNLLCNLLRDRRQLCFGLGQRPSMVFQVPRQLQERRPQPFLVSPPGALHLGGVTSLTSRLDRLLAQRRGPLA